MASYLIAILAFGLRHGPLSLLLVLVAFYRLQDFMLSTVDQALQLTGKRNWPDSGFAAPILISLVNLCQLILVFAIAYQGLIGTTSFTGSFNDHPHGGRVNALYLSFRSVPPLAGGDVAVSGLARSLSVAEAGCALVMLAVTLSRFLSASPRSV